MVNESIHLHKSCEVFWELSFEKFEVRDSNNILGKWIDIKECIPRDCDGILISVYERETRLVDAKHVKILLPHQLSIECIEKWVEQYPKCTKITALPIKFSSEIKVIERRRR